MIFKCKRFNLNLSEPKIMGVINLTPDSFYDGGLLFNNTKLALNHAESLLKNGADILDIGGESTRPGADFVPSKEEWNRIKEVLKEIHTWNIPISLDTRKTYVMKEALEYGYVDIINDIFALRDEGALELLAKYDDIGLCIMHMQNNPQTMQENPYYENVVEEVINFLGSRIETLHNNNIDNSRIIIDLGIGFGKNFEHNIQLLKSIPYIKKRISLPMLIGISNKSLLGKIVNEKSPNNRLIPSVAMVIELLHLGVNIVRVHDVKETKQAILVWDIINK